MGAGCAIAIAFVSSLFPVSLTAPGDALNRRCAGRSEVVVLAATTEMTDAAPGPSLQPPERHPRGGGAGAVVVVAVRAAAREISKTAAVWALTHVVQHGDSILLLVLIPPQSSGMCMHCIFIIHSPRSSVFHYYGSNCFGTSLSFKHCSTSVQHHTLKKLDCLLPLYTQQCN